MEINTLRMDPSAPGEKRKGETFSCRDAESAEKNCFLSFFLISLRLIRFPELFNRRRGEPAQTPRSRWWI